MRLDDDTFRLLYERTARQLRAYLRRMVNDEAAADDLLQDTYLRVLEVNLPPEMSDEWLKNYLFRIATNLARDKHRKRSHEPLSEHAAPEPARDLQQDMEKSLQRIKPKERQLLWLAYVERFTHEEIGKILGARTPSIRVMLSRARHNLATILKGDSHV